MPRSLFACTYDNCTAIFRHSGRYERHLLKHSGERPFKCTYDGCDKTYSCSSHLKRHETTHEIMFKCTLPGCSMILKTMDTLMKHQDVFHKKKRAAKKYKCPECSKEFTKRCMLTRHSYVHTGVQTYKCSEPGCDKSFSMPSLLKRHMKRHVGYFCEETDCTQYFPRWSLLCKHRRECHPKIFRCHICEKVFKYACNLKSHSLTHKLEKDVFRCTVPKCIRVYTSKHTLSDHVRDFHKLFTIACPEGNCPRFFKTEEALETHVQWRHRRRGKKKPPPSRPEFAEILSGFAKGMKKELNPHLSNAASKEECEESNDETMEFKTVCLDSSDAAEDDGDEQCTDTQDSELNQRVPNAILEEKIEKMNDETFEIEVIILDSTDAIQNGENQCLVNDENSKQDLNPLLTVHDDDKLQLDIQGSKPKLKDESVENEVVISQSLQNSARSDKDQCLSGKSYCFSCKAEADQLWTSPDVPIRKVK